MPPAPPALHGTHQWVPAQVQQTPWEAHSIIAEQPHHDTMQAGPTNPKEYMPMAESWWLVVACIIRAIAQARDTLKNIQDLLAV